MCCTRYTKKQCKPCVNRVNQSHILTKFEYEDIINSEIFLNKYDSKNLSSESLLSKNERKVVVNN